MLYYNIQYLQGSYLGALLYMASFVVCPSGRYGISPREKGGPGVLPQKIFEILTSVDHIFQQSWLLKYKETIPYVRHCQLKYNSSLHYLKLNMYFIYLVK